MSTGIYIRLRGETKEIDECTEPELIEHFSKLDKNQVVHWLVSVLETLNAQIEQLRSGELNNRIET